VEVKKESISEFVMWNRLHVTLHTFNPRTSKQVTALTNWKIHRSQIIASTEASDANYRATQPG